MKFAIIFLVMVFFINISCAQDNKTSPPETVQEALKSLYPDAKNVEWEYEDDNFEAEFIKGDSLLSIVFNSDGEVIETEAYEKSDKDDESEMHEDEDADDDDNEEDGDSPPKK